MMKKTLVLLVTIISIVCQAQKSEKYNLGFENQSYEKFLSDGWLKWGSYELKIDSIAHSGEKSGKITSPELGGSFGSIAYKIPAYYSGEKIQLEGYMKIKNVENGFAGLLLRIDGNGSSLAFDNIIATLQDISPFKSLGGNSIIKLFSIFLNTLLIIKASSSLSVTSVASGCSKNQFKISFSSNGENFLSILFILNSSIL